MYDKEFILMSRYDALEVVPGWVGVIDAKIRGSGAEQGTEWFVISFEYAQIHTRTIQTECFLFADEIDLQRFGPCLSPQYWMILDEEVNSLKEWMTCFTIPMFKYQPEYNVLCEWLVKNARAFEVEATMTGLPYKSTIEAVVTAKSKEEAQLFLSDMCSGLPVCWNSEEHTVRSEEVGWVK